jgi:hypothetical protein
LYKAIKGSITPTSVLTIQTSTVLNILRTTGLGFTEKVKFEHTINNDIDDQNIVENMLSDLDLPA